MLVFCFRGHTLVDNFIYELQKSTTIAFSRDSLYTFYSRNPTCGIHQCLRISNHKYPPCPQNSIIVNPPSPSEILKAVRGMVWIFSGIAQCQKHIKSLDSFLCYNFDFFFFTLIVCLTVYYAVECFLDTKIYVELESNNFCFSLC